jgi:hypothetical protein
MKQTSERHIIQLCTKIANVSHEQPETAGGTTNPQARNHCVTITELSG